MTYTDKFHHIRLNNASSKAANPSLKAMEFRAHRSTVNEYDLSMLKHLINMTYKTLPTVELITSQPEINLRMRPLLLDFLMDVCYKMRLSSATFFMTINLIDRYCSTRIVRKQHFQLLGLTSLWLAAKTLEKKSKIPSINDLCKMCCNCYSKTLFLEMENHLLKSLNWLINCPTSDSFIDLYMNKLIEDNYISGEKSNDIKTLSLYLCELIQFYPNLYFNFNSCQISLISLMISINILQVPSSLNQSQIIELFISYTKENFLSFLEYNSLLSNLIKVLKCPPPSLKLKYFNDHKYYNLMLPLINFTNKTLFEINSFPHSPISNQTSPKSNQNYVYQELSINPHMNFETHLQTQTETPPLTPFEVLANHNRKRSASNLFNMDKRFKAEEDYFIEN